MIGGIRGIRGKPEEEVGKGNVSKYNVLDLIHKTLKPKIYLEIGVQNGRSLSLANCIMCGVDPDVTSRATHYMTSDEFFSTQSILPPDFVFIDGLHLIEQVLKDFINCERVSHFRTVIAIDDVFPAHPAQAERTRRTKKWCGDVWKILPIFRHYRPDLKITMLNSKSSGMILIQNLDPGNEILSQFYEIILTKWVKNIIPFDWILNRDGVHPDTIRTLGKAI